MPGFAKHLTLAIMEPALEQGVFSRYPLFFRWDATSPLPTRLMISSRRDSPATSPYWLTSGNVDSPFDFCGSIRRLLADICARSETFQHIQPAKILIAVTQARNGHGHGLQARVTPLRFPGGHLQRFRRGVPYQVQRYFHGEHEFLYLMTFCLPRFQDQDFDAKFITLFHELYHIGPAFDGDLRRHRGRYAIHSHSQCAYDRHMAHLARDYLTGKPDAELHAFLRLDFRQLAERHGGVSGVVVPRAKIVPLDERRA